MNPSSPPPITTKPSIFQGQALALMTLLLAPGPASQVNADPSSYTFTPITYLGDPAPGGGVFANNFQPSRVNNRGEVAFVTETRRDDSQGEGVFLWQHDGAIKKLARFGDPAPGGGTFATWEFDQIGLNDAGDVAFAFSLEPLTFEPAPLAGIFRYSRLTETLTAIALPGDPRPGGGVFLGLAGNVDINNQGAVVFQGHVESPVPDLTGPALGAIFKADKRNRLSVVATPADGFGWLGVPSINNQGDIAFAGWTLDLLSGQPWHDAIFLSKAPKGQLSTLVKPVALSDKGDTIRKAFHPKINEAGEIVFQGVIEYGAVETDAFALDAVNGVFLYSKGEIRRIAAPGDALPGGGTIAFIPGHEWKGDINAHGQAVFAAVLENGDEGLYLYSNGSTHLIAKKGSVLPGVGTLHSLEMQGFVPPFEPPLSGYPVPGTSLNDRGQVAFACTLTDGRVVLLLATPR